MWKAPSRPNNQITQGFNDGIVLIYVVKDKAEPGYKPVEELELKARLRYEEQRLGINRLYLSRQNQAEILRVLRIPRTGNVGTQDMAVTEDGKRYRIDSVQSVPDVYPPSLDISLTAVRQNME